MTNQKPIAAIRKFLLQPNMLLLIFTLAFVGFYYARAFVSLFDVTIFALGILNISGKSDWKKYVFHRYTIPFMLIYVIYLLSLFYSDDTWAVIYRLKTNNYYLLIPLGIAMLQPLPKELFRKIILSFVIVSFVSACFVFARYLLNAGAYNEIYKTGKTMPTPILHIRYSLFLSFAFLLGLVQLLEREITGKRLRYAMAAMVTFLFIFIHILAVRSGILSLYFGLFILMIIVGRKYVRTIHLIGLGFFFMIALVLATATIPSLKNKWQYTRHDISMFFSGSGHYLYSDNLRLISIKNGLKILETSPMIGTGIGDIEAETIKMYQAYYPEIPPDLQVTPINQIIFTLVAFGYVGCILFYIFFFYPLSYPQHWQDPKVLMIYAATFASFIGHETIELQLGKAMFLILISISLWDLFHRQAQNTETANS